MNPLKPELMSTEERLDELCRILALGLVRVLARQSSRLSADRGESAVDFTARARSGANRNKRRTA
jgi:hypothetical protein